MSYVTTMLLALALSMDSFGVGIAYGIKRVKISLLPIIAITLSSVLVMTIAVVAGRLVANVIPDHIQLSIGAGILMLIGIWQLLQGWKNYRIEKAVHDSASPAVLLTINLKALGLVLQVLQDPVKADLDQSGEISLKEAFLLGIALNIDAMGAGLGAGIADYSLFLIPIAAISLFVSILLGLYIGKHYARKFLGEKAYIFPGLILIFLAAINFLR